MSKTLIKFSLDDLNKFAPDGIVFEAKKTKLENGEIKNFIHVIPIEYRKKYPYINKANNFTYTSYSLDDLTIDLINSDIANANSKSELTIKSMKNKGNNFGKGDYPYKNNDNIFNKTKLYNEMPQINWKTLDSYGKITEQYFQLSSKLQETDKVFTQHKNVKIPKKSIFNNKYKQHVDEYSKLHDIQIKLEKERDILQKKQNEIHKKLIDGFNAPAILAYAYRAALDEKILQKFNSKDKYKQSIERLNNIGVKSGKQSGVVHAENLVKEKRAMDKSPYKPIILDKAAKETYDAMAEKVRNKETITPKENKQFIKQFFDKSYE
ncbi:MAG: hypothetical protein ACOX7D_03155 [Alphaproteobacteria bacterium]|jgi:hypothetical protein